MAFNLIKGFINTVATKGASFVEQKIEKIDDWAEKKGYNINLESGIDEFVSTVENKIKNAYDIIDADDDGKVTSEEFFTQAKKQIEKKIEDLKETKVILSDLGKTAVNAIKFTNTNKDLHAKELIEIYTNGYSSSLVGLGITMLKHNMEDGAYMDMSNLGQDIKDIYNEAFSNREDRVQLAECLQQRAEFATSGQYKNYLAPEDTLTKTVDGIKTAQTCLNVCDYFNMGTSAGIVHIDDWNCISEGDAQEKNAKTGFWGKAYVNEDTKQLLIGFCATNSMSDWGTDDVQMVKGEVPEQYQDALDFYNKYANDEKYADYEKVITGHSMGGSLGQLVGSTEGVNVDKVIAFNPFGTYDVQNNKNDNYNFVNNDSKIFNYINEYDIVSCAARHVGQTTLLNSISMTVVGNHLIDTMHYYLNERREEIS